MHRCNFFCFFKKYSRKDFSRKKLFQQLICSALKKIQSNLNKLRVNVKKIAMIQQNFRSMIVCNFILTNSMDYGQATIVTAVSVLLFQMSAGKNQYLKTANALPQKRNVLHIFSFEETFVLIHLFLNNN